MMIRTLSRNRSRSKRTCLLKFIMCFYLLMGLICCGSSPDFESIDRKLSLDLTATHRIVGGQKKPWESHPEMVLVTTSSGHCSGIAVAPRAVLTAAHCLRRSQSEYTVVARHRRYRAHAHVSPHHRLPYSSHDIALLILEKELEATLWPVIGRSVNVGQQVEIAGFGCHESPWKKGRHQDHSDPSLHSGNNAITALTNTEMDLAQEGGAYVCFGDSGGAVFAGSPKSSQQRKNLIGIISAGNIESKSVAVRLDVSQARDFLVELSNKHNLELCGINSTCVTDPSQISEEP